ncbi:MAG: hypothetical protein M4579_000762 [Chaenotheca gracillima]|nr:MAG: hypothetical protein M4579_000762 [Chaenotheca gracillima]
MNYQNGYNPAGFAHPPPQQFPPPAGSTPQHFPTQAFAHPSQHQQRPAQQQHPFGAGQVSPQQPQHHPQYAGNMAMGMGFDMGAPMGMSPNGPMMMTGGAHPQMAGHGNPYTNAPYAQMPPALANSNQVQQPHSIPQQLAPTHQPSKSPSTNISPPNQNHSQFAHPMSNPTQQAAPSPSGSVPALLNQSPQSTQQPQQPLLSPAAREREKERVSLLLLINGELIKEVVKLQGEGKAGIPDQTQKDTPNGKDGAEDTQSKAKKSQPHPEYIECMRRLQANLAYLATIADRSNKPAAAIPASPAILVAPEKTPHLAEPYKRLLALFPGAPHAHKPVTGAAKPASQSRSSAPSSQPLPITPQPGRGNSESSATNPAGATLAEQNYKRWLEEMRRSSPQRESLERG